MDRLDALKLFVRIVESGSFAAAAREAGIGQPSVSKQIAALERHLGAQLIRRTSRSMTLTETGQSVYEAAVRIVGDVSDLESSVGVRQVSPTGHLRVTVAPVFGRMYIVPHLGTFFARYPKLSVELSTTERTINLVEEGFDIAIKHGRLDDSNLISRQLASSPLHLVATPAYFNAHGRPTDVDDLARHACIVFAPMHAPRAWRFVTAQGPRVHVPSGSLYSGDAEHIRTAVLADMGMAQAPGWMFAAELESGAVVRVLEHDAPAPLPVHAVHAFGRRVPNKARVFIDFVADILAMQSGLAFHTDFQAESQAESQAH
ncbi:LysR family transcriptional regulator [Pararobbsia silviterrae]|uniref:LysR family transcriptional regulator n=1 Tax=Pararobbsia silviterrae TaxID=1792498 RepID=A0A494XST5_9BURK|nr:LysR family transcriptional regulator [Pararobbsia silviterrae]RKP53700.1 LysR family transcriptional regulator [Pararobbsia silviterrae]